MFKMSLIILVFHNYTKKFNFCSNLVFLYAGIFRYRRNDLNSAKLLIK